MFIKIKKHWFLISFLLLLFVLISSFFFQYSIYKEYSNYPNQKKITILAESVLDSEYYELASEEINIVFNKYKEIGYDLEKTNNANIYGKVFLSLLDKYKTYSKLQEFLTKNNVDYIEKETFIENHVDLEKFNNKILIDYNYYSKYLFSTATNYLLNNKDYTKEKNEIKEFLKTNFKNLDSETFKIYEQQLIYSYAQNDLIKQLNEIENQK